MGPLDGNQLMVLAAAASARLAQGRSADELELLSAFFEVLGDNLALLALYAPGGSSDGDCPVTGPDPPQ